MKKTTDVDHYNCFPSVREPTLDGLNDNSVNDQTDPVPQPSSTREEGEYECEGEGEDRNGGGGEDEDRNGGEGGNEGVKKKTVRRRWRNGEDYDSPYEEEQPEKSSIYFRN